MNANEIPRIVTPLVLAAAIVVSFQAQKPIPPVELEAGEAPLPSPSQMASAWAAAVAPDAPGFDRGASRASVTVLEFADFGCRYCAAFAASSYPVLAAEFVATGRVRWTYVPFVLGMFPNGELAARSGECAGEQGPAAFGRMHDRLFADQARWESTPSADPLFRGYAAALGLDTARFAACYASETAAQRVRASNELADRMGVRSTPTFFINGARLEGALPPEEFRAVLLQALGETR